MRTVFPENQQTSPSINSVNTIDMVEWWTKNGSFNWLLYRQIIEAKRFFYENQPYEKK